MMVGQAIGPYSIIAKLGEGGMGEVYRAIDSNLKRSVAIKVLPASVAGDADRLARFQREAEVLAALNHPNIGAIYGLEKTPDFTALVMELVEGDDLTSRIARGAIPIDEALPIAKQIADALEAAHEQNIIHRDLKPANIKVREDGTVKVLDFGLAKAMDPPGSSSMDAMHSPTLSVHATTQGVILGTAAYMAPEQARGKAVDRRADVWAFGAVLYEMLTGTRAFAGDDITILLASVLKDEVRWDALPADVPAQIRRLLRRCLEKDPKRRLSAIGDARLELDDAGSGVDEAAAASAPAPLKPAAWRRAMPAVIAALAVGSAGTFGWWLKPVHQAQPVIRVTDTLPAGQLPTGRNGLWLAISADGSTLVYGANQQLFIRATNALAATALAGTEGATAPFFSFDGQWIGFSAGGKLKKVSARGGSITTICDTPASSASWGTDNQILLAGVSGRGVFRVPASGGNPEVLIPPSPNVSAHYPQMLRGGRRLPVRTME